MGIQFKVVYTGKQKDDLNIDACSNYLADLLKKTSDEYRAIIQSGKRTLITKFDNKNMAIEFEKKLNKMGMLCETILIASGEIKRSKDIDHNFQEEPTTVTIGRGGEWFLSSFYFFMQAPLTWLIYFCSISLISNIPNLLNPTSLLQWPLAMIQSLFYTFLTTGIIIGLSDQYQGKKMIHTHLLSGVQIGMKKFIFLIIISLFYTLPPANYFQNPGIFFQIIRIFISIATILVIQLIVIDRVDCLNAIKLNFKAIIGNIVPFIMFFILFTLITSFLILICSSLSIFIHEIIIKLLTFFAEGIFTTLYLSMTTVAYFDIFHTSRE